MVKIHLGPNSNLNVQLESNDIHFFLDEILLKDGKTIALDVMVYIFAVHFIILPSHRKFFKINGNCSCLIT